MRCGFSFGFIMNYVAVVSPYAASGSVFVGHDILSGVRQASDEAYRYLPVWHQLEIKGALRPQITYRFFYPNLKNGL